MTFQARSSEAKSIEVSLFVGCRRPLLIQIHAAWDFNVLDGGHLAMKSWMPECTFGEKCIQGRDVSNLRSLVACIVNRFDDCTVVSWLNLIEPIRRSNKFKNPALEVLPEHIPDSRSNRKEARCILSKKSSETFIFFS